MCTYLNNFWNYPILQVSFRSCLAINHKCCFSRFLNILIESMLLISNERAFHDFTVWTKNEFRKGSIRGVIVHLYFNCLPLGCSARAAHARKLALYYSFPELRAPCHVGKYFNRSLSLNCLVCLLLLSTKLI